MFAYYFLVSSTLPEVVLIYFILDVLYQTAHFSVHTLEISAEYEKISMSLLNYIAVCISHLVSFSVYPSFMYLS